MAELYRGGSAVRAGYLRGRSRTMLIRNPIRREAAPTAAVAALAFAAVLGIASPAGASGPTEGSVVNAIGVGNGPTRAPFSSGQLVNVVVPTNSLFVSTTVVNVLECSAPNGVAPTSPRACDGNTINGPSLFPSSDGSINFQTSTGWLYEVFDTPDAKIGDASGGPACGNTVATECILYIGENQNDFTQPHVWSQPFFVAATPGDTGANPGDGSPPTPPAMTPEAPMDILLPLLAMGLMAAAVVHRRHRTNQVRECGHPSDASTPG
jgi:hypothetical protein